MKEEFEEFIKKNQEESEQLYKEVQQMQKELREYNVPKLHYIFTLTLSEGSFLDLNSINGWQKYISLNIGLFNKFVKCEITQNASYPEKFNSEQFILPKIDQSYNQQMCKCSFEGVEFEVFTNGRAFEVILDPLDKGLELKFSQNDIHKLDKFFERWGGEALVQSFGLDEYIDKRLYYDDIYESIYDSVLNLNFHSFIIYTYPESIENTEIEKLIKSRFYFPTKPILANIWINNGACIRDILHGNPPFQDCIMHIKGHVPDEYSSELMNCIKILYRHMNFWSMVHILENFMGNITEFQYFDAINIKIKKIDVFKGLIFGKDREHIEEELIGKMRSTIFYFLDLGLKSNHRGLEEDASEQYLPRYITGEYYSLFENSNKELTKKVLANVTDDNIIKLKDEFHELWVDLEKRIENLIETTRDLERKYYQEYQLRLVEKTQELTLLSIMIAILIFLISKIPFNKIVGEILILWDYLKNLFYSLIS